MPKILCLGGTHDSLVAIRERFGSELEVVEVSSPVRAWAELAHGGYIGIYADADHLAEVIDAGRFLQYERILQGMPDGVVMLDHDNTILWGNGRLREWAGCDHVVGQNFYDVLGNPEIVGPDFCPFHTALTSGHGSASTLRCDHRYFRVHATPVIENDQPPQYLIVTIRDVTDEMLQQQKMAAIRCHATQITSSPILNAPLERQRAFLGTEQFIQAEARKARRTWFDEWLAGRMLST